MLKHIVHKSAVHVLLIALIGFAAYANTFHVPFHWDDRFVIIDNPIIRDLRYFIEPSRAEVFEGHFEYTTFKNRYIGYLTFALNYKLHGLNVAGYHIFNVLVHIVNGLLIYLLVILTFKTPFLGETRLAARSRQIAVFTALLFVCHPVQTEAVTYIWQRVASLATMFYLLSLNAYVQWRLSGYQLTASPSPGLFTGKTISFYVASVLSAALAMKTKEIAFTLPLMVMLYELVFFEGSSRRRLIFLLPLLLTMLIIPFTILDMDKPAGEIIGDAGEEIRGNTTLSRWNYLLAEFRVIITYVRLIVLPVNQNIDYDYPGYSSFFDVSVFASFLFLVSLAGMSVFVLYRYRRTQPISRVISFGIFWFFICLALESSIIPLNNVIFEHRLYLPSIGLFLALVTLLYLSIEKAGSLSKGAGTFAPGILVVIIVLFTGATYTRNAVWKDEVTLWSDAVQKSPDKKRPRDSLGLAYNSQGLYDKAIPQFRASLRIDPYDPDTRYNLGIALQHAGKIRDAIEQYRVSVEISPHPDAYYNLGHAYHSLGLLQEAIKNYVKALTLRPDFQKVHYNLAIAYRDMGLHDKANEHFEISRTLKSSGEK